MTAQHKIYLAPGWDDRDKDKRQKTKDKRQKIKTKDKINKTREDIDKDKIIQTKDKDKIPCPQVGRYAGTDTAIAKPKNPPRTRQTSEFAAVPRIKSVKG
jgi:hypothetical protein